MAKKGGNKNNKIGPGKAFILFVKKCPYTIFLLLLVFGFWGFKIYESRTGGVNDSGEATEDENAGSEVAEGGDTTPVDGNQAGGATDGINDSGEAAGDGSGDSEVTDGGDSTPVDGNQADGATDGGNDSGEATGDGNTTDGSPGGEVAEGEISGTDGGNMGSGATDGGDAGEGNPEKVDPESDKDPEDDGIRWKPRPEYYGQVVDNFYYYEPVTTKSKYYYDVGKIALTTPADYQVVEDDYFADACWIGDSRCVGICDYSGWNKTDFYCDNGFCVYDYSVGSSVTFQRTGKKYTVEKAMDRKPYGKIYIMLGMNDTGYGTTESFQDNLKSMLDMVYEKQPNAIVYLVANLRVSKSGESGVFTNVNINAKNVAIAELADGERSFYLDYNEMFTDENGYLLKDFTFDGFHLYASGYAQWADFFREHAIVRD